MISDEEIDKWYNSLSLRDKFNGWKGCCCNNFWSKDRTSEEIEEYNKHKSEELKQNKRIYYNRIHNIKK